MSVADLLVPNPYPLNVGAITTPSINANTVTANTVTVPGTMVATNTPTNKTDFFNKLNVNATGIFPPVDIVCNPPNSDLSIRFFNGPGPGGSEFGTNGVEASPSAFIATSFDIKFIAGGAEQLRIKNTGIASDPAATIALTLGPGTELRSIPMSSSGAFASTWTSTLGFAPAPGVVNIQYIRVGDVVSCQLTAYNTTLAAGTNTARISLPVARAGNFTGVDEECSGDLFANGAAGTFECIIEPVPGTTNEGIITLNNGLVGAVSLRGSFSYRLSP